MKHLGITLAVLALGLAGCAGDPPPNPALVQPEEPVLGKRAKYRHHEGATASPAWVMCVSLSPDGKRCLAPQAERLRLWDVATGQLLREFEPTFAVEFTALADDIKCMAVDWEHDIAVTGDGHGVLRVWNLATGNLVRAIQANKLQADFAGTLRALALSEDCRFIYSSGVDAGQRAAIKVWDLESGKLLRIVARSGGNAPSVPAVEWVAGQPPKDYRPDLRPNTSYRHFLLLKGGKQALLSGDVGYVALWDLEKDNAAWKLAGGGLLDATPDGKRSVEIPNSGSKLILRGRDGNELRTIKIDFHRPAALRVLPDGKRAVTGGEGGDLVLWDLDDGSWRYWEPSAHNERMLAIDVSVEGNRVLTGGAYSVLQLWDLNTRKIVRDMTPPRKKRLGP